MLPNFFSISAVFWLQRSCLYVDLGINLFKPRIICARSAAIFSRLRKVSGKAEIISVAEILEAAEILQAKLLKKSCLICSSDLDQPIRSLRSMNLVDFAAEIAKIRHVYCKICNSFISLTDIITQERINWRVALDKQSSVFSPSLFIN
uniref:Uncharacterized protein n=1 Tax=Rhizophagus irregularis (strain DAOM 181602 / DAOM 197198 / MUCL 43194) TaxID=747089 RepID=U9UGY7_RHIID